MVLQDIAELTNLRRYGLCIIRKVENQEIPLDRLRLRANHQQGMLLGRQRQEDPRSAWEVSRTISQKQNTRTKGWEHSSSGSILA
jgi:hypothetical protein